MLYIVPTPIGNLADLTYRAVETLNTVDYILAEDTRTSSHLLKHYQISKPLKSFHAHNEHKTFEHHIDVLKEGGNIALISDAGTPGISDPGFLLIRAAREAQVDITVLPGATAFVPALVGSGIPCDKFYFEGFLPVKKGRQTRLKYLAELDQTIVLYVSPHKLLKDIDSLIEYLGAEREACIVKEISKLYEHFDKGTLEALKKTWSEKSSIKGEYVMIVAGNK
jgi:16S rRNA (cytidine1402-2'-O)-methyltransferase